MSVLIMWAKFRPQLESFSLECTLKKKKKKKDTLIEVPLIETERERTTLCYVSVIRAQRLKV